ncbi:MAG: hypothetical protein J1E80_02270, partial [Desulfovibrionaceae bacterium]|nr:hypothetical protein [Desulfovibrionaceae bacterium]
MKACVSPSGQGASARERPAVEVGNGFAAVVFQKAGSRGGKAGLDVREPLTLWEKVRALFGWEPAVTFSPEKTVLTGVTKKSR